MRETAPVDGAIIARSLCFGRMVKAQVSNPGASYVTLLSVSGYGGILRMLKWNHTTGNGDQYLRMTVDGGTTRYWKSVNANATNSRWLLVPPEDAATSEGAAADIIGSSGDPTYIASAEAMVDIVKFSDSLLIEVKGTVDDFWAMAVVE